MKRKQFLLVLVILIVLAIVGTAAAAYMRAGKAVARYEEERPLPGGAALYDQRGGTLIKRLGGEGSIFVPLEKIPPFGPRGGAGSGKNRRGGGKL